MPLGLQVIDIGSAPGDKTGDPGRTAFSKMNQNAALLEAAIEDAERKAFVVALTPKDTVVAVEADIESFRIPYAFVLLEVRAEVAAEHSGDDIEIDIKEEGVSIFGSELLTIPAGSDTSVGYSPQPDVEYVLLEDNNRVSFDVVSVGTEPSATGLKVTLIGYVIWTTF